MNDINSSHEITLQQAIDMTTLYRTNRPPNFPICETFEVDAISKLIATPECKFVRIYYGMKEDKEVDAILVAANADGQDLLPASSESGLNANAVQNIVLEDGFRCPQFCPPVSVPFFRSVQN